MPNRPSLLAQALACSLLTTTLHATAADTPQEAYWLLDEVRTVAFELSQARTGKVAAWPRMTVRAGAGVLPMPMAKAAIKVDHRLDEPAWANATSFPVGPIFADWREGPFVVKVRVCRDAEAAYLAIESSRDLARLGSIKPSAELFVANGNPIRLASAHAGSVAEFSIALARPNAKLQLAFPCEMARRVAGKLPVGLRTLGVAKHFTHPRVKRRQSALWLDAIAVDLVPADTAAQIELDLPARKLAAQVDGQSTTVRLPSGEGVLPYQWRQGRFRLEGFAYVEPVEAMRAGLPAHERGHDAEAGEGGSRRVPGIRARYCRLREARARTHLSLLDSPLLLVKRHPYFAGHIYDDYYPYSPGGGIYVLENPSAALREHKLRPIIDATTEETLGEAVYRDPDLSWDAKHVLLACKRSAQGMTSIYEIGVNGRGLRQLTRSDRYHDITPAYLPDARVVFNSTRPRGRVPCFNSGVDTLHVMNADGSGIHSISANNVNEFDPALLPDGRILYGRWEYVDKTALYMQSLWTVFPDGTHETALFGNNLAKPTALLDARPVPGTPLVVASLTPHNGQAVGAIATIDPRADKNGLAGITNFTPEYPVQMDQGLHVGPCDPWPLSEDAVLMCNNAVAGHGVIELVLRSGHRELVHVEPDMSCYGAMPLKPRPKPARLPLSAGLSQEGARPAHELVSGAMGRFLVLDVYRGLEGVERGSVKALRLVEETTRTSEVPPGGRWWNQAFLISWQGAYVVKNVLGTVPVYRDGSAYFEAPAGRALYFEALDGQGREVQRMRTFVQALPGVTRSCIGCHENKQAAPTSRGRPLAAGREPVRPRAESWGSGFVDYPTMVQPLLDRHCVGCHGGPKGMAAGIDLSGGWTWAFSISYESLLKRNLVGFLRCHNSDVTSSRILPPYTIGSGAARLAGLLLGGHKGRIPKLSRSERELLFVWMDGNSSYYGAWDYTGHATCRALLDAAPALSTAMRAAGCTECHPAGHIGNDWVSLQRPEWSRILRAPMARRAGGLGLGWCRKRKASRGLALVTQRVLPPDVFHPPSWPERDPTGGAHAAFADTDDPHYQAVLRIIRRGRAEALARPRVDMPGAEATPGQCRFIYPPAVPSGQATLRASLTADAGVRLSWTRDARTIGLHFEVHRGPSPDFAASGRTLVGRTYGFSHSDFTCAVGPQHYALAAVESDRRVVLARARVVVPQPQAPAAPSDLSATPWPGEAELRWSPASVAGWTHHVYRRGPGAGGWTRLTDGAIAASAYTDREPRPGQQCTYAVTVLNRRQIESPRSQTVSAAALPEVQEPTFVAPLRTDAVAKLLDGSTAPGRLHRGARIANGALDLTRGGHATFAHRREFDLGYRLSVECWVRVDRPARMPVILSCGAWRKQGWFLQYYHGRWRWHVAGVDCDGGRPAPGRWFHLVGVFDGRHARLFENGRQAASRPCNADLTPWRKPLFVGQYGPRPGADYQVYGLVTGLKLYRRAVGAKEATASFRAGRP